MIDKTSGNRTVEYVTYPSHRVRRAIHLIRNPFDNVVSRFHLERHSGKAAESYPKTKDGFRDFCFQMNALHPYEETKANFLEQSLLETLKDVPCRGDFIRYMEWHNLAFATAQDLELETYVLHYDWYSTRFNQTVHELVDFLHLQVKDEPAPFVEGKVYTDYFTAEERGAVQLALESIASRTSWYHIQRYFVN